MALNSYFDFAENDFQYFKASYDAGIVANMMGAMAQGICEKYMKHLISEYYKPDDAMQQKDFENILRTHSLNRLMKFLKANMGAEFSKNTCSLSISVPYRFPIVSLFMIRVYEKTVNGKTPAINEQPGRLPPYGYGDKREVPYHTSCQARYGRRDEYPVYSHSS